MTAQVLTTFDFEGCAVRIQDRAGNPWWVLPDVCRVLEIGNPSQAASRLDDDEKRTLTTDEGDKINGLGTVGAMPTIISESGLYSLILTSRKEAAKRFKKWVTGTVLPSIRKHGAYIGGQEEMTEAELLAKAVLAATRISEERANRVIALEGENAMLGARVEHLAPKAAALDLIANKSGSENISTTAKGLRVRPGDLFAFLDEKGWVFRARDGAPWRAYQAKIDAGYLAVRETPDRTRDDRSFMQVLVTPKGRAKLAEMLTQGDMLRPGGTRKAA